MAKSKIISNPAFERTAEAKPGFHLAPQVNPFTSIFETALLDEKTTNAIDRLMVDLVNPETADEEQIRKDAIQLKNITVEVRAIEKQGILLVGERLCKAREILVKYGRSNDGFLSWLKIAFKQFSTAYNAISYYELYKALPKPDLQARLKEMPNKAAYVLASRKGPIEEKAEIIEKYSDLRADEIITIVQDKFPTFSKRESKKSTAQALILSVRVGLKKLLTKKRLLENEDLKAISECRELIDAILETKFVNAEGTKILSSVVANNAN
jgi:hypothetical protein